MEVTTSSEALRWKRVALGGSVTTRAARFLNAVQASKPIMRKPTRLINGEGCYGSGSERYRHRPAPPG